MARFWSNLFGNEIDTTNDLSLVEMLKKIPIFSGMTRKELAAIERIMHQRFYQPEEIVFRQHEPGMGMYIIASGNVAIILEPSQTEVALLGQGDFFGEMSLLDESPRSATAIARSEAKLFGLFQPDVALLVERNPKLGLKLTLRLAREVVNRLREANARLEATMKTTVTP